jgi:hypothetical protein
MFTQSNRFFAGEFDKAASNTLAYAYDDSAIATLATLAGNASDAEFFRARSVLAYKQIWHAESEYVECLLLAHAQTSTLQCTRVFLWPFRYFPLPSLR